MREVLINGKWPLKLPESSATEWEGTMACHSDGWELERLELLKSLISPGTVVLYIGAYKGDMPALLASWGARLIMVEGSAGMWDLIRQVWDMNELEPPLGCFSGLASTKTTSNLTKEELQTWPARTVPFVEGTTGFASLAESQNHFPEITVDDLLDRLGLIPNIITIDAEGAELPILQGASSILSLTPLLLLSIHPEFGFNYYGYYERDLHNFVIKFGYGPGMHIAYDHESHTLFQCSDNPVIRQTISYEVL